MPQTPVQVIEPMHVNLLRPIAQMCLTLEMCTWTGILKILWSDKSKEHTENCWKKNMQKPAHNQEENLTQGNRPTKQQRTRTARIISRPRETTTLSNLGSSIREALKISACENTSTCLHASRNQLLLSPNLDAASMLQEIKDRQSLKDFPKTKMLYTENKTLPRSIFHNRFTWPRAYNPPSASEIPFILGHSCSSQTRSCSDMVGLIYLSARIRRPTISSTDFSCCNSVSTVEPAGDFSLQSQGTLKPETQTEACPSSSSVKAPKKERTWREAIRRHKTPISVTFSSKELSRCQSC